MAGPRKYLLNHDFFNLNQISPLQFYWAGFIASTASVNKYRIEFNTGINDRNHLERMVLDLDSDIPIRRVFGKEKQISRARLIINSKIMVADLGYFGIKCPKYNYRMPEWLEKHQYVRDFIRGWVDGKGGFYVSVSNNRIRREFRTSGQYELLTQFHNLFKKNLSIKTQIAPITRSKGYFKKIRYLDQKDIEVIALFLYEGALIFIDRKKEAAEKNLQYELFTT